MVPGDGQHVIWSFLVGHNRARYFLLTGKKLSAQEALEWGAVNEVLPKDQVLDRAWELARELVKRPPLVLRYTRQLFTNPLKRVFVDELGHGLGRETYAQQEFFPFGGGMEPPRPGVGRRTLVPLTDRQEEVTMTTSRTASPPARASSRRCTRSSAPTR